MVEEHGLHATLQCVHQEVVSTDVSQFMGQDREQLLFSQTGHGAYRQKDDGTKPPENHRTRHSFADPQARYPARCQQGVVHPTQ